MATEPKPISLMQEKTSLVDNDLFEVVDSAETNKSLKNKKVKFSTIKSEAGGTTIEEGNWTPVEGSVSITVNQAYYLKQGRLACVQFDVTWPTTSDTTNVIITGLPASLKPKQNTGTTRYLGTAWHYENSGFANSVTSDICEINDLGSIYIRGEWTTYTGFKLVNADLSEKRVYITVNYLTES